MNLAYLQAEGLKYEPDLILLGFDARQRYQGQKCTAGGQSAGSDQMARDPTPIFGRFSPFSFAGWRPVPRTESGSM